MWSVSKIVGQNILSLKEGEFRFVTGQVTQIIGVNLDNEGANSNGSGKSTLIECLVVGLTGSSYRDILLADVVRDGEDQAFVAIEMVNNRSKETLRIERTIRRKSASVAKLFINDQQDTQAVSVADVDKRLLDRLGVSKADLLSYFILNQGNGESFLTATDAEKKAIINRFCDLQVIETIVFILKETADSIKDEQRTSEVKIAKGETRIEGLQEAIEREQRRGEEVKQQRIASLNQDLARQKQQVEDLPGQIKELDKKVKETTASLNQAKQQVTDPMVATKALTNAESNLKTAQKELNNLVKKRHALEVIASGKVTCPECGKTFIPADGRDITDVSAEIDALTKQIKEQDAVVAKCGSAVQAAENQRKLAYRDQEKVHGLQMELDRLNNRITSLRQQQDQANAKIKQIAADVEALKKSEVDQTELVKLNEQLSKEQAAVKELRDGQGDLEHQLQECQQLLHHFGKTGFQAHLASMVVGRLETLVNHYLNQFATDMYVKITGYSLTAKGEVRDKIDVQVMRGSQEAKLGRFSGGERNRLQLASVLAVQQLLNNGSPTGGLDLLVFDETFENLDRAGQQELYRCLGNTGRTVVTITHQDTPMAQNIIQVTKQNRVTVIA